MFSSDLFIYLFIYYLRQEVMFSSDLFIYLFIYLFVSKIAQKLTSGFG